VLARAQRCDAARATLGYGGRPLSTTPSAADAHPSQRWHAGRGARDRNALAPCSTRRGSCAGCARRAPARRRAAYRPLRSRVRHVGSRYLRELVGERDGDARARATRRPSEVTARPGAERRRPNVEQASCCALTGARGHQRMAASCAAAEPGASCAPPAVAPPAGGGHALRKATALTEMA
jgi:hypothetical protein